mgnify:CR=1 FL=1
MGRAPGSDGKAIRPQRIGAATLLAFVPATRGQTPAGRPNEPARTIVSMSDFPTFLALFTEVDASGHRFAPHGHQIPYGPQKSFPPVVHRDGVDWYLDAHASSVPGQAVYLRRDSGRFVG